LLTRALLGAPNVELRLVTHRDSELARRAAAHGVAVMETPWTMSLDPRALWRLARELGAFRPHLLHAHDSHALQLTAWARRLRGGGPARPKLIATRRVDFRVRPGSVWFQADHVIAISQAIERILLADGVKRSAISVVPSGIDPAEVRRAAAHPLDIRARLGLAADTPLAVNVAALVDHKDHRTLIRAAHAARAARPNLHWAIAGDGALRRTLDAEIRSQGVGDRVHLLGYVPEADALIREADVFVMSSKEEGLGSVVLHALALGTPVVATRGGGLPELVPHEWLVPVGDADALARRVVFALDHPSPIPLPPQYTAAAMAHGVLAVYRALT
jgi:glycosyltransferase involved in cell wall biosynthesis